jgi:hypothetical protein
VAYLDFYRFYPQVMHYLPIRKKPLSATKITDTYKNGITQAYIIARRFEKSKRLAAILHVDTIPLFL